MRVLTALAIEVDQQDVRVLAAAIDVDGAPERSLGADGVAEAQLDARQVDVGLGELAVEMQRRLDLLARLVDVAERQQLLGQPRAQIGRRAVGRDRLAQLIGRLLGAPVVRRAAAPAGSARRRSG